MSCTIDRTAMIFSLKMLPICGNLFGSCESMKLESGVILTKTVKMEQIRCAFSIITKPPKHAF